MASRVNFINDITPMKETWKVKVRIIRLWKVPSFENPSEESSIEMVLMDEKGSKISAYVKKSLIKKFSVLLSEGEYRILTNFGVGQNMGSFKTTQHPYKINFLFSTSVRMCEDLGISLYGFSLISFDDIMSNKLDDTYLIDVIGEIFSIESIDQIFRNGKISKRVSFEIRNLEGKTMKCTLWELYAEQLATYVASENHGPIVIIIQFAKIKIWQGRLCIQNSLFSTRLYINEDIDAIMDFKKHVRLDEDSINVKPTQLSSQISRSITEDFLQADGRKTLDEIRDTKEVSYCVTVAKIICIQTEYNWFYLSCKKCSKKVKETENYTSDGEKTKTIFYCSKCSANVSDVIPRYKVQVRVLDETGSTTFVMFDREVVQLLHKSAYYLMESLAKESDVDSFPEALDELLERKLLFKIEISEFNIKNNWQVYTVKKLSDDEQLIKSFLGDSNLEEVNDVNNDVSFEYRPQKSLNDADKESISFTGDNYRQCDTDAGENGEISPKLKRQAESSIEDVGFHLSSSKKKVIVKKEDD